MLNHIPSLSIALWSLVIVSQSALAILIRSRKLERKFPFFSLYVYFACFKSFALLYIASYLSSNVYFYAYYGASWLYPLLLALVVYEVYKHVYGPSFAIPEWVVNKVVLLTGVSIITSFILSGFVDFKRYGFHPAVVHWIEFVSVASPFCALLPVMLYAKKVGKPWRSRMLKIVGGFVFWAPFYIVAVFLRCLSRTATVPATVATQCAQAAYLVAVLLWSAAMLEKEVRVPRKSREALRGVFAELRHIEANANQPLSRKA